VSDADREETARSIAQLKRAVHALLATFVLSVGVLAVSCFGLGVMVGRFASRMP
jgi:hypothetical protein